MAYLSRLRENISRKKWKYTLTLMGQRLDINHGSDFAQH